MLYVKTSRRRRALLALMLALSLGSFIPAGHVRAAAGDLDPTFGMGGMVLTDFSGSQDQGHAIAVQPDGKMIIGVSTLVNGGDFALARYDRNGNLDPSFGSGGKVLTDFDGLGGRDGVSDVALQPDGKIVAVGATIPRFRSAVALARYNSDGSLDATFGSGGKVVTAVTPLDSAAHAVTIQPDGKLVVVGSAFTSFSSRPKSDFAIIRYNPNGGLDSTFGNGGIATTNFHQFMNQANDVAIQPDGKIVVGGVSQLVVVIASIDILLPVLARFNRDGSLDTGFGTAGKVIVDGSSQDFTAGHIALQADGKIISAGGFINSSMPVTSDNFSLVRYNPDGSRDSSFGTQGRATADFYSDDDWVTDLTIDPLGRVVAVGIAFRPISRVQDRAEFAVARFTPAGSLDTSFASGGRVSYNFFGFDDEASAVALQPDGKILAAGTTNKGTDDDSVVLRLDGGVAFDLCLQDDGSGNLLRINSATGEYLFTNCNGLTMGGTGTVMRRGNTVTLQHNASDRRVQATADTGAHRGAASVQSFASGRTFSLSDRDTTNDTCGCP